MTKSFFKLYFYFFFFSILDIQITSEDEKLRDQEGYLAIKAIHGVLDNDQSGSIERYESADVGLY